MPLSGIETLPAGVCKNGEAPIKLPAQHSRIADIGGASRETIRKALQSHEEQASTTA
jgi:hypothetical protein